MMRGAADGPRKTSGVKVLFCGGVIVVGGVACGETGVRGTPNKSPDVVRPNFS